MGSFADRLSRRRVIQSAGLIVAVGGTAAACSGSEDPSPPASKPSAAGDPAGLTVVGAATQVPVGGAKIFSDAKVVVSQPREGEFKAFSTRCPHQGCAVSAIVAATVTCPCHGSAFSTVDGSPTQGPATEPLEAKVVKVSDGKLEIT